VHKITLLRLFNPEKLLALQYFHTAVGQELADIWKEMVQSWVSILECNGVLKLNISRQCGLFQYLQW